MPSAAIRCRACVVRTHVSEERIATIIMVERISELRTMMTKAIHSSEMSVLTTATRRNIPESGIFHSHRRENLKSYIALTGWAL
jgi:hypothetical protein